MIPETLMLTAVSVASMIAIATWSVISLKKISRKIEEQISKLNELNKKIEEQIEEISKFGPCPPPAKSYKDKDEGKKGETEGENGSNRKKKGFIGFIGQSEGANKRRGEFP